MRTSTSDLEQLIYTILSQATKALSITDIRPLTNYETTDKKATDKLTKRIATTLSNMLRKKLIARVSSKNIHNDIHNHRAPTIFVYVTNGNKHLLPEEFLHITNKQQILNYLKSGKIGNSEEISRTIGLTIGTTSVRSFETIIGKLFKTNPYIQRKRNGVEPYIYYYEEVE